MARFTYPASSGGGDVSFTGEGCIVFPNDGEICNVPNSSGDGYGYSTIQINPDTTTNDNRYIIIDPTAPNHIHMRAGGTQDESSADLFLGGERNNVRVSDSGRDVVINARPAPIINTYTNENPTSNTNFIVNNTANIYIGDTAFVPGGDTVTVDSVTSDSPSAGLQTITANLNGTPAQFVGGAAHVFIHEESWNHSWLFNDDGYLTGPAMGGLFVSGLLNGENDLWLGSNDSVVLNGGESGGEFLNDSSIALNQIATIGDIVEIPPNVISTTPSGYYGSFLSTIPQSATIINTAQPVVLDLHEELYGVTIVNDSEITIEHAGVYNLQFSAQMHNNGGGGPGQTITIWLNKNGSAVPNSATRVTVSTNSPYIVAAWNFIERMETGGENLQLMWATDNTNVSMPTYTANGIYPAVPSVILTLTQVASL